MHAAPVGGDVSFCNNVEGRIGGPGGIWLEQKGDLVPPSAPQLTSTDPASPSASGMPRIRGSAEAGSTVRVYAGPNCAGPLVATESAAKLGSSGIAVPVAEGVTAAFSATAADAAANISPCSAPNLIHALESADPLMRRPAADRQDAEAGQSGAGKSRLQARHGAQAAATQRQTAAPRRQVLDPGGGRDTLRRHGQPQARSEAPKSAPLDPPGYGPQKGATTQASPFVKWVEGSEGGPVTEGASRWES